MSSEEISDPGGHIREAVAIREWRLRTGGRRRVDQLLEEITCEIVDHFSNVSRITDGIKFTMRELNHAFKDLEQDLAKKEAQLLELGNAYANFS